MNSNLWETGPEPAIRVEGVGGDLRLYGWDNDQVSAEQDDVASAGGSAGGAPLTLRAAGSCTLYVPRRASVTVDWVGGDGRVKNLEGPVDIRQVGGDLTLRETGPVVIGRVGGDVKAEKVDGTLRLEMAGGDALVRGVAGDLALDQVGGDLSLHDVGGSVHALARADARVHVDFAPGQDHEVQARGDLSCRLSPAASARVEIMARGDVSLNVPGSRVEGSGR